jgi:hypothetical protein
MRAGSTPPGCAPPGSSACRRRCATPPRYLLPLIPSAVEAWDLSGFDVVLSSSVAFVKNVTTAGRLCTSATATRPMRFAWDYWPRYVDEMEAGPLKRLAVTGW